jgi:hypothetical protein
MGNRDIFLTKISSDGSYAWTKTMGGTNRDVGHSVAVVESGDVYVTGWFEGTADFDFGAGVDSHTAVGNWDIFLTKISSDGSYAWTKTMGGEGYDEGYSVAVDGNGNVYVTGDFQGTTDFDPGVATDNHSSAGGADIFLTRINSNGSYGWTKTMGGADYEQGSSVAVFGSGNVYVTGYFEGTMEFHAGDWTDYAYSAGGYDIFLTSINPDGTYGWTKTMGGTDYDYGNAVAVEGSALGGSGNIYVAGSFQGTAEFDPTGEGDSRTSVGNSDIFLTKFQKVKEDLVVDFGPYGIYVLNNGTTWSQLHSLSPEGMVTGDLDGNGVDEIIFDFGDYGTYVYYNNSFFSQLHSLNANAMATGDLDGDGNDDFITTFEGYGYGTYIYYNNSSWVKLHGLGSALITTGDMDANGQDELIVAFEGYGLYIYYNNSFWSKLHSLVPELIEADEIDGDIIGEEDLIVDFGQYGTYIYYNNAAWVKFHNLSPTFILVGDYDELSAVFMGFNGYGLYGYDYNYGWVKLHNLVPETVALADIIGNLAIELIADFGSHGIYAIDFGSWTWTKLHNLSANDDAGICAAEMDGN